MTELLIGQGVLVAQELSRGVLSLSLKFSELLRGDGQFKCMSVGDRPVLVGEGVVFEDETFQLFQIHRVGYFCIAGLSQRFDGHFHG